MRLVKCQLHGMLSEHVIQTHSPIILTRDGDRVGLTVGVSDGVNVGTYDENKCEAGKMPTRYIF